MAITLTNSREAAASNGVKCAIYGLSGMGKTKLCATAPKPVIISAEKGLLTLRNYDIPVIEVKNFAQMWEAHKFLTGPDGDQFETICLDSVSEIAEQVLSNAKLEAKDPRQAYGQLAEDMIIALKAFRDIEGKNVVMLAKQGTIKDDLTGVMSYGPSFPGSIVTRDFPYLFDEVFQIGMQKQAIEGTAEFKDVRVMRTQPDMQYTAKDRSSMLPPAILVPDMPDGTNSGFLTWVFQEVMKDPAPVQQPA